MIWYKKFSSYLNSWKKNYFNRSVWIIEYAHEKLKYLGLIIINYNFNTSAIILFIDYIVYAKKIDWRKKMAQLL